MKFGIVDARQVYKSNILTKKIIVLLAITVIVFFAVYNIYNSNWFQTRFIHPLQYRSEVEHWSQVNRVSPSLVAGVILAESKFAEQAESERGAQGLMQIMPTTGAWIADQNNVKNFQPNDLQNSAINIRFGTWYLHSLLLQFGGNEVLALAAYNAGRGNVEEWMKKYEWSVDSKIDVQQLPYPETRAYVNKVLLAQKKYQKLYGLP